MVDFCEAVKTNIGDLAQSHGADAESAILAALNSVYLIAQAFFDEGPDRSEILHRSARLLTALATGKPATLH
jgi:hypothetical protein